MAIGILRRLIKLIFAGWSTGVEQSRMTLIRREQSHSWDVGLPAQGPAPQSTDACSPAETARIRCPQSFPSKAVFLLFFVAIGRVLQSDLRA